MHIFILTLHLFVFFNHVLMALILLLRKNNTLANKFLAAIIIIPVCPFIVNLLVYLDLIYSVAGLLYLIFCVSLTFGPTVWFYFQLMIGKQLKFRWVYLLHLVLPFSGLIAFGSICLMSVTEKMALIERVKNGTDEVTNFFSLVLLLHILFYLTLSWRMQKKHYGDVKSFFTDLQHTRFFWVRKFIRWMILINVLFILAYAVPTAFFPSYVKYADLIAAPLLTLLIYLYIFITGFSNQAIFTYTEYKQYSEDLIPFNAFIEESEIKTKKYGNSALEEATIQKIESDLNRLFEKEKPYLDKELSLNKLAELLGITSHQLSQFINRHYDKKFFDFINHYRVEEAKILLTHPSKGHLKIEAIGEEAGFNSRATFFIVFKKITGESPATFKKKVTS